MKEVIQGHLPVALPCYDFRSITNPTVVAPVLQSRFSSLLKVELIFGL